MKNGAIFANFLCSRAKATNTQKVSNVANRFDEISLNIQSTSFSRL